MATLYTPEGKSFEVFPEDNAAVFTVRELRRLVRGNPSFSQTFSHYEQLRVPTLGKCVIYATSGAGQDRCMEPFKRYAAPVLLARPAEIPEELIW